MRIAGAIDRIGSQGIESLAGLAWNVGGISRILTDELAGVGLGDGGR